VEAHFAGESALQELTCQTSSHLFQRCRVHRGEGDQARKGSREAYAHVEERGGWRTEIDENLAAFLGETNSFYLSTASADGQPYIQHRGGPKGFVKVLDKNTIAFADYSGNRQYITQGNLSENPKAHIFVMDYAHRRRVKIWGEARVVDDDPALTASLMPRGYKARPEHVILFKIAAWDTNCPQHIPQKFDAADVAAALASREARIAELEAELAALKGQPASTAEHDRLDCIRLAPARINLRPPPVDSGEIQ
jgi:predicted pyridoxine 5'-phosphate oxidase superfamily flavin-nucleotide-binding protein